MSMKTKPVLER